LFVQIWLQQSPFALHAVLSELQLPTPQVPLGRHVLVQQSVFVLHALPSVTQPPSLLQSGHEPSPPPSMSPSPLIVASSPPSGFPLLSSPPHPMKGTTQNVAMTAPTASTKRRGRFIPTDYADHRTTKLVTRVTIFVAREQDRCFFSNAMDSAEFSVPVRDLEDGTREYVFPIRPDWVKATLEEGEIKATSEEGRLEARLSKTGKDVVVQGHIQTKLEMACARCTKPAHVVVDAEVTALMVPAGSATPEDDESPDLVPYDGQTVVLDELVHDEILLGIPMIPLCSEDCPGMSTGPQKEEAPIDPRLEPLKRIKLSK
jgi:uncharacterized protein